MTFLSSTSAEDRAIWRQFFDALPPFQKDVHFLPEYVEAHIPQGMDAVASFAMYEDSNGEYGAQPFVRMADKCLSPYGYGAVFGTIKKLPTFCLRYRCHPLIGHQAGEVEKHVVVMDLVGDLEAKLRKGHKSSIALARRSGVIVEEAAPTDHNIIRFWECYRETMQRRNAVETWRLPCDHFIRMRDMLDQHFALFFARVEDEIESACIVLHGYGTAYYHFAGTLATHPKLGVNNLMVLKVAQWAKDFGYRRLHLGGGVTADPKDKLLKFKSGFTDNLVPVHSFRQ